MSTHVITSKCIGVKSGDCVDVCPVDCIHPKVGEEGYDTAEQLYIDPATCIGCHACEDACPVAAIVCDPEDTTPEEALRNEKYFKG